LLPGCVIIARDTTLENTWSNTLLTLTSDNVNDACGVFTNDSEDAYIA